MNYRWQVIQEAVAVYPTINTIFFWDDQGNLRIVCQGSRNLDLALTSLVS
jgi:hypothetical protein